MNQTSSILSRISGPAATGALFMVAAGACFAVVNIMVQATAMGFGQSSASIAFWQYLVALVFFLPWVLRHGRHHLRTAKPGLHVIRVMFAAVGVQLWVLGLAHVPIWQAIALIMVSPFFVTAGAGLFLQERVDAMRWLAVTAGFIGGLIILAPWSDTFTIATLLPLGAALFWALSSLLTKRLAKVESAPTITVYLLLLLTPINAAVALGGGLQVPAGPALALIAGAGVITAAAQYALARAYVGADAAYLQPFDHLKLPFNVVLGWLVFGFIPVGSMWLGAALIVGASIFILRREVRLERLAQLAPAAAPS